MVKGCGGSIYTYVYLYLLCLSACVSLTSYATYCSGLTSSVIMAPKKMMSITSGLTNFHSTVHSIIIRGPTGLVVTLEKKLEGKNERERNNDVENMCTCTIALYCSNKGQFTIHY